MLYYFYGILSNFNERIFEGSNKEKIIDIPDIKLIPAKSFFIFDSSFPFVTDMPKVIANKKSFNLYYNPAASRTSNISEHK